MTSYAFQSVTSEHHMVCEYTVGDLRLTAPLRSLKIDIPGYLKRTDWPLSCRCLLATNSMITFDPVSHAAMWPAA